MSQTCVAEGKAIDSTLIVPFFGSIRAVFNTMLHTQITVGAPYLRNDDKATHMVSTIVGFSGQLTGSVTVSFTAESASKIASEFAGTPLDLQSPDFADAIGELANMIAGAAKKHLAGSSSITIPSVVIGPDHAIARHRDIPCVVIPCTCQAGPFTVEVSIKRLAPAPVPGVTDAVGESSSPIPSPVLAGER